MLFGAWTCWGPPRKATGDGELRLIPLVEKSTQTISDPEADDCCSQPCQLRQQTAAPDTRKIITVYGSGYDMMIYCLLTYMWNCNSCFCCMISLYRVRWRTEDTQQWMVASWFYMFFLSKLGVTYPIFFGCGVAHAHARSEVLPPVALQHYKRLRRRLKINQCYAEICSMFWALGMDVWWGCGPLCRTCCCCSMISTPQEAFVKNGVILSFEIGARMHTTKVFWLWHSSVASIQPAQKIHSEYFLFLTCSDS